MHTRICATFDCHCHTAKWWVTVWPIAAYRRTPNSSLQLGLRVDGRLALTDFYLGDQSELSKWLWHKW